MRSRGAQRWPDDGGQSDRLRAGAAELPKHGGDDAAAAAPARGGRLCVLPARLSGEARARGAVACAG